MNTSEATTNIDIANQIQYPNEAYRHRNTANNAQTLKVQQRQWAAAQQGQVQPDWGRASSSALTPAGEPTTVHTDSGLRLTEDIPVEPNTKIDLEVPPGYTEY